jgi:hypothetical protein
MKDEWIVATRREAVQPAENRSEGLLIHITATNIMGALESLQEAVISTFRRSCI